MKYFKILLIIICSSCFNLKWCNADNKIAVIKNISYFEDINNRLSFKDIHKADFKDIYSTPNFGLSKSTFWIKIIIENNSNNSNLLLEVQNNSLNSVILYSIEKNRILTKAAGEEVPFSRRVFASPTPLFQLNLQPQKKQTYFLKISSNNVIQIPIVIGDPYFVLNSISFNQYIFGIYLGIMFIMFFYNLFIYITVKDSNYLYYVLYILTICFTQACLKGYSGKYLWPENSWLIIHTLKEALNPTRLLSSSSKYRILILSLLFTLIIGYWFCKY